ncbi:hypothetical protein ACRYCC_07755 [Actinomadura scrupuli]|uniref:hypothetical protein n=1 Tax=Actinomadura scrupuli TaxID=559629 RepID=UPI003D99812B
MSRRPLGPCPGMGYGHLVSTTPGAFVTKEEWIVHPITGERPERGRQDRQVECATCGKKLTVRVSSLERTRWRQQNWPVMAGLWMVVPVLCGLLIGVVAGDGEALGLFLLFGLAIGAVAAFAAFMRSRLEDGVTMRWPTITRIRGHKLRWPSDTDKSPG